MDNNNRQKNIATLKGGYTKWVRIFEVLSIFSYIGLACFTIFTFKDYIINNPLSIFSCFLLGWLLADFSTGCLHWLFDTWGKFNWPILGKLFVRPFLEHHIEPNEITKHDWIETNGSNLFVGLCILGSTLFFSDSSFTIILVLCISFWGSLTNQFHKWSHQVNVPKYVTLLQKSKIILSTKHHNNHHYGEYDYHYCITSGVLNNFLDKTKFFRILEWSIQKITGQKARDNELPID